LNHEKQAEQTASSEPRDRVSVAIQTSVARVADPGRSAARAHQVPRSGRGREEGGFFDRLSSLIGADQISED